MAGCRIALLIALALAVATPPGAARPPCRPTVTMNSALQPLVDVAVADLARRLQIDATSICVADAQAVIWPDRSYGCPQSGMQYPQVPQDGFLIRLQAQGRSFAYHGGGTRPPFLCESAARQDPPGAR